MLTTTITKPQLYLQAQIIKPKRYWRVTVLLTTELIPKPDDTYKFNNFHGKYYHIQYVRGGTLRGFDVMAISSA